MQQAYLAEMRSAELRATEARWDYIKGDFVEYWINSANKSAKFMKKDWHETWLNHVRKQINFNRLKWKSEEEGRKNGGSTSRLGSLDNDYLKDADWDRIARGEG